jgi:glycosyltransferase involved in cell wall biosynthesis
MNVTLKVFGELKKVMLNIISRSVVSTHSRGPRKVVASLLKGLDEIGYPYVVNAALDATDTLWIHDDKAALEAALSLPGERAIIAGPNIYTLPSEVPGSVLDKRVLFLQPAVWVQEFWNTFSLDKINTVVWPVGIDTKNFSPDLTAKKDLVLVYNKQRSDTDMKAVCAALDAHGERYEELTYGKYTESQYQNLLQRAQAVVWVGRSESQGIGLLEALSMNVPVLVWDVTKLGDFVGAEASGFSAEQLAFTPVTAAPYFDERCGMRFVAREDLDNSLRVFLESLHTYSPRSYVESELPLGKQATALLDLFKTHFNISDSSLKDTALKSPKRWQNGTLCFKCLTRLKDAIRQIIR